MSTSARTAGRRIPAGVLAAAVIAGAALTAPHARADGPGAPAVEMPAAGSRTVLSGEWGDDDTNEDEKASALTGSWRADEDLGSLYWVAKHYGAHQVWTQDDPYGRKVTGKGVTVAVIDTGVSPVPGLDTEGKVVNGPDLSFESQADGTRYLDGYGHGTHMAAIIAGRDAALREGNEHDATLLAGVAPDAQILNMKVGAADGGTDVSQVIAAIDWVVQHRRDNGMDVRVINLSYGTRSLQSYELDPLAHAVQNAWRAGIVVVVAAGNDGLAESSLTMPGRDPYVIAVGAVDHRGTGDPQDDVVAAFTNGGEQDRRPDLLAPGKSLVSLRVPGSAADRDHPEGMVTGDADVRLFRGSGTSQAAAVVSGAVALLLQDRPELTPDQVKALLTSTATPLKLNPDPAMGAGVLDIQRAVAANTPDAVAVTQSWPVSTGLGTLEASRGADQVIDPVTGAVLTGEVDALGSPWDGRSWSTASAAGTAWSGGDWNGRSWSGSDWSGRSWSGAAWAGRSWSGRSWSGDDWQGRSWSNDEWNGRSWSDLDWQGRSWSGRSWSSTG